MWKLSDIVEASKAVQLVYHDTIQNEQPRLAYRTSRYANSHNQIYPIWEE